MSVYTNQTNANADSSFYALSGGGGGGGSNINQINVSTINFTSAVGGIITTYPAVQAGPGGVVIGTSNGTQPLTVSQLAFGEDTYGVGSYQQSLWTTTGLNTQGFATGTSYSNVIAFNSQIGNNTNDTLSYYQVSTIGTGSLGAANQINVSALVSTLRRVYPGTVL